MTLDSAVSVPFVKQFGITTLLYCCTTPQNEAGLLKRSRHALILQIPLLARDIEIMSIERLTCSEGNDKQHLRSIITTNYRSPERFQQMVQASKSATMFIFMLTSFI